MTRKRKNLESNEDETQRQEANSSRTFPRKVYKKDNDYMERKFDQMYGKVGGGDVDADEGPHGYQPVSSDHQEFPKDLVGYLKGLLGIVNEGNFDEELFEKCLEECKGQEATLLSFQPSCLVIEQLLVHSAVASAKFLCALDTIKNKRLLDIFFHGSGARSIEKLICACFPIDSVAFVEVLEKFVELLCDNWNDAVSTQSTCFLLRTIIRTCSGLGAKPEKPIPEVSKFTSEEIRILLRSYFDRIADACVNFNMTGEFINENECSLLLQEVLYCDKLLAAGKCDVFISHAQDAGKVFETLSGKNSSRIWECAFNGCSEERRKNFWELAKYEMPNMSCHPVANFPAQQFFKSIESIELGSTVYSAMAPFLGKIVDGNKVGVVISLVQCKKSPEDEETMIKELRKRFNASKTSNKSDFLLNVLTMNKYMGRQFNACDCTLLGAQLLEALLNLEKLKTLTLCLKEMSVATIRQMAFNRFSARVLQAALRSSTLEKPVKKYICNAFKDDWNELISNPVGSHTFDAIWDCSTFDLDEKIKFMKKYNPTKNTGQGWKFAMLRCDLKLYRSNPKAWREKMKHWKKTDPPAT